MNKNIINYSKYIILILFSSLLFFAVYGFNIINPTYTDWLLGGDYSCDLTQHYLGWLAYKNYPWEFPIIGMSDVLSYPEKTSVIFTDSIPLFAVIFKILSPIFPANFQYFGIYELISFILQALIPAKILSKYTNNTLAIICASIMFLFIPALLLRMFFSMALTSHWIIFWCIYAITDYKFNTNLKKLCRQTILLAIVIALIHIYFLPMCGIIFLSFCISELIINKNFKLFFTILPIYIFTSALTIYLLGGFSSSMELKASIFGYCGANLNTFINPQTWSSIVPDLPMIFAGQEVGLAYLGLGFFFLAAYILIAFPKSKIKYAITKQKLYLSEILTFIFSMILSSLYKPSFGKSIILNFDCPYLAEKMSVFGASGRFIWPAMYLIMLQLIIVSLKIEKRKIYLCIIISCALILQAFDISKNLFLKNERFQVKQNYQEPILKDTIWENLGKNKDIKYIIITDFYLTEKELHCFANWSILNNKKLNTFDFARPLSYTALSKNTNNFLNNIYKENLYIFTEKNKYLSKQLNLHLYYADGYIIGYSEKLNM